MNSDKDKQEFYQQFLFTPQTADNVSPLFSNQEEENPLEMLEQADEADRKEAEEILAFSQEPSDGHENAETPENETSENAVVAAEDVEDATPAETNDAETSAKATENVPAENSGEAPVTKRNVFPPLTRANLIRAALGFLRKLNPSGMGVNFNSGTYTHVDVGAFFLSTQRKKALVGKTVAVLAVSDTKRFQMDIACRRELLETLSHLTTKRLKLEENIRENEPEICDETLFQETCVWHYEESKNKEYLNCLSQIAKVQYSLVKGNVFERFISNQIADELYVVTTENLIAAEEVPARWGLVYIDKNFKAKIVRKAEKCETTPEKRLLFALRAASSSPDDFLFAKGITTDRNNNVTYHPVPRNRKPYTPGEC